MKINITTNNIDLNDHLSDKINNKGNKILKYITSQNEDTTLDVKISKDTNHHRHGEIFSAEYNLSVEGRLVRATSSKESIDAAIDHSYEEMIKRLRRSKGKWKTLLISGARKAKGILKRKR
jgi:ribosomal subunit interface protein